MSRLWSAGKQEEAETLFSRVAASARLRAVLQTGRPRPATGEQCRKCWAGLGWAGLGWVARHHSPLTQRCHPWLATREGRGKVWI